MPLLLLLACALAPVPAAPAPAPPSPAPISYALELSLTRMEYLTREKDLHESIAATASLDLLDGGVAIACLGWDTSRRLNTSHFASADGEDHVDQRSSKGALGLRGRWTPGAPRIDISFDEADRGGCSTYGPSEPVTLSCERLTDLRLPGPSVRCSTTDPAFEPMKIPFEAAMETPVGTHPWTLLFSALPGLRAQIQIDRDGTRLTMQPLGASPGAAQTTPH